MNTNRDFIDGLRAMAEFLEAHPTLPAICPPSINAFVATKEALAEMARLTSWAKGYDKNYMWLSREFPGGLKLDFNIHRGAICRRVVKGTHIEPERVVEDVEWICDDASLLAVQA